jgi:hypothetical protein
MYLDSRTEMHWKARCSLLEKGPAVQKRPQVVSDCSQQMTQKYTNPTRQDFTVMMQLTENGLVARQLLCLLCSSSQ